MYQEMLNEAIIQSVMEQSKIEVGGQEDVLSD